MAELTRLDSNRDVWEFSVEDEDTSSLQPHVWDVVFENTEDGDKSSRHMFADQKACTITTQKGWSGTDIVTITDRSPEKNSIGPFEVTFSGEE
jgi:hypothetical protein